MMTAFAFITRALRWFDDRPTLCGIIVVVLSWFLIYCLVRAVILVAG